MRSVLMFIKKSAVAAITIDKLPPCQPGVMILKDQNERVVVTATKIAQLTAKNKILSEDSRYRGRESRISERPNESPEIQEK